MSTKLKITLIAPCSKAMSQTIDAAHHTVKLSSGMTTISFWKRVPDFSVQDQSLVTKVYVSSSFSFQITAVEDSDGTSSADDATFAIRSPLRDRWFSRKTNGFVTLRSPECEFPSRDAAWNYIPILRAEEEDGTDDEAFEVFRSQ